MANNKEALWSYNKSAAYHYTGCMQIVFTLTQKYANWPDMCSRNLIITIALAVSFMPLMK